MAKRAGSTESEYDRERKAEARALQRDVQIPQVKDPGRREGLRDDDAGWLRTYLASVFYFPFTSDQLEIIAAVGECLRYGLSKCIAAPRSDGKSSITKYLCLKYALYRQSRFPLMIAATGPKADGILASIKSQLRARRGVLAEDFPLECGLALHVAPAPSRANNVTINGGKLVRMEWRADRIILPTLEGEEEIGPILMAEGIGSESVQGCNVYDIRPDFVMLDDLDSRDSLAAAEGTMAAKIETTIDQNIAGLGGQGRRLGQVMLCTIPSRRSIAFKYSDPTQKPAWSGIRIKRLKKWPDRRDLCDDYIAMRQKGMSTFGANKKPIDKLGRVAHKFLLDNFDAIHAGAELSNPNDYNRDPCPDGSQMQVSALQKCLDYIADKGEVSFQTEHQNDPPPEEGIEREVLTAYHVQHHCRSGLDQHVLPAETAVLIAGCDNKKLGFHFQVWAFDAAARGACVDYGFHELNTDGMKLSAVEVAIYHGLREWRDALDARPFCDLDGEPWQIDLAMIDSGWKEESWLGQPVYRFCAEAGFGRFLPCKGESPYRRPKPNPREVIIRDNCHISFSAGVPLVVMNSDHWKQKVHEGFLLPAGAPGSLALFNPPKSNRTQPHMGFAKHIVSEVWERRFVPGFRGTREGWWKVGSQNHQLDACYEALVGCSLRGISPLAGPEIPISPVPPAAPDGPPIIDPPASPGRNRW